MMNDILAGLRNELKKNSDQSVKDSGKRFFKEDVKLYGVRTATVSSIARRYFSQIKDLPKLEVFSLCEKLWQSGFLEETFMACSWSYYVRKQFMPNDIRIFERWIKKYVTNWASCDTFCNHTVGSLLEMYPEKLPQLKKWAMDKNRWMRRASAVSLIVPARKGNFSKEIFEIALILLKDPDDMVQKGYGWMLKVLSQSREKDVFGFVMEHKKEMPRTALRYAIEKMPDSIRRKAMKR